MSEEKRISSRRKKTRRMHDALGDKLSEEEKQMYDKMLYTAHTSEDRRNGERRSGKDRRAEKME
ncbi:MAG: hypothetical protein FWF99_04520 [Desulfovibrionaceae bacterium]|nr:hypothetical protein [Desulfovibrionaceae bacterium]